MAQFGPQQPRTGHLLFLSSQTHIEDAEKEAKARFVAMRNGQQMADRDSHNSWEAAIKIPAPPPCFY